MLGVRDSNGRIVQQISLQNSRLSAAAAGKQDSPPTASRLNLTLKSIEDNESKILPTMSFMNEDEENNSMGSQSLIECGAMRRRIFFEMSHQDLKEIDDESINSEWESMTIANLSQKTEENNDKDIRIHLEVPLQPPIKTLSSRRPSVTSTSININVNAVVNKTISSSTQESAVTTNLLNQELSLNHRTSIECVHTSEKTQTIDNNAEIILLQPQTPPLLVEEVSAELPSASLAVGLIGVWKHSSLLIITLVKKFQNMLMSHNNSNKFRALDQRHFDVIGDKSVDSDYYNDYQLKQDHLFKQKKKAKAKQKLQSNLQNMRSFNASEPTPLHTVKTTNALEWCLPMLSRVPVIQPNSRFRISWNCLMLLVLFVNFMVIPLKLAFDDFVREPEVLNYWTYISGILLGFDMAICFNSAYFSKGLIITDRRKITRNYIKRYFLIDLIVLVGHFLARQSYNQFEGIILINVFKLTVLIENFEEILNLRQRGQAFLSLAKLIIFVVMVAHILGCMFFLFARVERMLAPFSSVWVTDKLSADAVWMDQYVISLYWSVVTMITVGYGDVTPINTTERLFVIVVMLISCGVFAYSLSSIGRIVEELQKRDALFRDNIQQLTAYLKQRNISYDLQLRIRKYFQYLHRENLEDNEKSEGLINLLPSSFKSELGREMYARILNDQKVFRLNFSQKFILELSLKMKEKRLGPEEIIFSEGDNLDKLFFLIKGQVELFVNVPSAQNVPYTTVSLVSKGRLVGQNAFFSQLPSSTGARCINVTSLVFIARDDFLDIIRQHPPDYERFCMLRDNLQVNSISRGLGTKCHLCGSFNHSFQYCHLIRYAPMKEKIIQRYYKMEQSRDPGYVRNPKRKPTSSARIAHFYMKETTVNYLFDKNPEDLEEDDLVNLVEFIRKYYKAEHCKWKSQLSSLDGEEIDEISRLSNPRQRIIPAADGKPLHDQSQQQPTQEFSQIECQSPTLVNLVGKKKRKRKRRKQDTSSKQSSEQVELSNIDLSVLPQLDKSVSAAGNIQSSLDPQQQPQQLFQIQGNQDVIMKTPQVNQKNTNISPRKNFYLHFKSTSSRIPLDEIESSILDSSFQQKKQLAQSKGRSGYFGKAISKELFDEDEIAEKKRFSKLPDLDRFVSYFTYFPEGNIIKVLEAYNNGFIHARFKDDSHQHLKHHRKGNKKNLPRSRTKRSMNILQTRIIQKRSQESNGNDQSSLWRAPKGDDVVIEEEDGDYSVTQRRGSASIYCGENSKLDEPNSIVQQSKQVQQIQQIQQPQQTHPLSKFSQLLEKRQLSNSEND